MKSLVSKFVVVRIIAVVLILDREVIGEVAKTT